MDQKQRDEAADQQRRHNVCTRDKGAHHRHAADDIPGMTFVFAVCEVGHLLHELDDAVLGVDRVGTQNVALCRGLRAVARLADILNPDAVDIHAVAGQRRTLRDHICPAVRYQQANAAGAKGGAVAKGVDDLGLIRPRCKLLWRQKRMGNVFHNALKADIGRIKINVPQIPHALLRADCLNGDAALDQPNRDAEEEHQRQRNEKQQPFGFVEKSFLPFHIEKTPHRISMFCPFTLHCIIMG